MNKWAYAAMGLVGLYVLLGRKSEADGGAVSISLTDVEKRVISYRETIVNEGYRQGMDPAAIAAVIHWESGGNTKALREEKRRDGTVWARSYGLMQILDSTADTIKQWYPDVPYALGNYQLLYDPTININMGTHYLVRQFQRYGRNMRFAFAGYNAGTCFVIELGEVKSCYRGQWGLYCNSQGDTKVNGYVNGVYSLLLRYRKIFSAIYPEYQLYFNPVNFQ